MYEDELDDNGISLTSLRIRVMNKCEEEIIYVLVQSYVRIDNVSYEANELRYYYSSNDTSSLYLDVTKRSNGYKDLKVSVIATLQFLVST